MNKFEIAIENFAKRSGTHIEFPRAALIDMDGTLYDSMPYHARAWHRLVTELGIEATPEEFFGYEGMTGKATINLLFQREKGRLASDEEADRLYERKTQYFKENNNTKVMPGAHKMLDILKKTGITPVLVTGSGQSSLISRLDADFDGAFTSDLMITSHDVSKGKPDPEPYLKALKLVDIAPNQAIVVENAPLGVKSGHDAGIFTVGVNTGPLPVELLLEAGADIVFSSMIEFAENLPELLRVINKENNIN